MDNKLTTFLSVAGLFLSLPVCYAHVTHVAGTVAPGSGVDTVLLVQDGPHPFYTPRVAVPVIDGKFAYDIQGDHARYYYLCTETQPRSFSAENSFFSEDGSINFDVKAVDGEVRVTSSTTMPETVAYFGRMASVENMPEYKEYEALCDSLYPANLDLDPEYLALREKSWQTADDAEYAALRARMDSLDRAGRKYSAAGRRLNELSDRVETLMEDADSAFVATNVSVAGLHRIASRMWVPSTGRQLLYADLYEKYYRGRFAGHPYVESIEKLIPVYRHEVANVGTRYTDVEALDADGEMKRISTFIDGKVALIDLWASWCGPCRQHSRELIPLYDSFSPLGFTVIGIGREFESDEAMRAAMVKDGIPWPSLAEINDCNMIWTLYGNPASPSRTVLVDRNGIILAIDPSPDELEHMLASLLE